MQSKSANNSKVSVAATTTVVLAASGGRAGLILVNDSNEAIYLGFGEAAVMNEGTRLNANGGALVLDNALMTTLAVNAICASGTKNLSYTEFLQN